jgi:hypothetical protein
MAICPSCTALFEEARRGREWLEFLVPGPEVPEGLLAKILAQTGPGQVAGYGLMAGGGTVLAMPGTGKGRAAGIPAWQRPGLAGQVRRFAEPRLLMTAAMAFFSIALTLNLTGVRLTSLRLSDLRPTAVRSVMERRLTMASTPIVRYYDHLRFVYEVQSRMRELRRTTEGEGFGDDQSQPQPKDAAPGESQQNPGSKGGGSRVNPPQQSVNPAAEPSRMDSGDFVETSLRLGGETRAFRRLQHGTTGTAARERSKVWTA